MTSSAKPIQSISGLRGLAALLVVWSHLSGANLVPAWSHVVGAAGVALFFTLSGFLMAMLYLSRRPTAEELARYATARLARIAPAYLCVVVVSFIIYTWIDPDFVYPISDSNLLRHLAFSGNASSLWSIPPEVQFYAVFALAWLAYADFVARGRLWPLTLVAVVCAALIVMRGSLPGTFVGSKIHFFALGACAGWLRARRRDPPFGSLAMQAVQAAVFVVFVLLAAGIASLDYPTHKALYEDPRSALFAAAAIFALSYGSPVTRVFLEHPLAMACGELSFSLYLLNDVAIHWFGNAVDWPPTLRALLVLVALYAMAWASNRAIERPGGAWIRRFGGNARGSTLPMDANSSRS